MFHKLLEPAVKIQQSMYLERLYTEICIKEKHSKCAFDIDVVKSNVMSTQSEMAKTTTSHTSDEPIYRKYQYRYIVSYRYRLEQ